MAVSADLLVSFAAYVTGVRNSGRSDTCVDSAESLDSATRHGSDLFRH